MIVLRTLTAYIVFSEDPLATALQKISANKAGVIFCVSDDGRLQGVLTDGDFRRWITTQATIDLTQPVITVANTTPKTAPSDATAADVEPLFGSGVHHVPLVDARGHLVAIATDLGADLRIGQSVIGPEQPTFVIAEIGINHNGSVDLAKRLVDLAVESRADAVKFQLRDMAALYRGAGDQLGRGEDLGPQYTLDLLARFSLGADDLFRVFDHCRAQGIDVLCTPWDVPSVEALAAYGIPALKIASADLTNHQLLTAAAATGLPLVMSTGMSTEAEIRDSVALLRRTGTQLALLHCQSTYPAPFKDVNLRYLDRLAEIGQCPVGYSGHERGFHVALAAVARGAKIIEKHFTVDKAMEGNDHKVSLLPAEFAAMVQQIREVEEALGVPGVPAPRTVSTGEMMNRVNLAKSLVAARPITVGQTITRADVDIKSPGRGLQPNALADLVGRTAQRAMEAGEFFYAGDLVDGVRAARAYHFRRPWGLPVRYHDYEPLLRQSNPDFLEFHFSYKDLDIDPATVFADRLPISFTTHSPDLFTGDFLLNLASTDDAHWERSIRELQRVIDTTRRLRDYFTTEQDPVIIASVGGFTTDAFVPQADRAAMYDRVGAGLARLDEDGVRLCAQTLPPFPWYMGGQLYCNLFVDPTDTSAFATAYERRLCLDISHSKLAANFVGLPFSEAVALLAPHADHLHVVDAAGVDGEGVQVGEGEIDWSAVAHQLDELAPTASFIPEIWQGHVDNGEGFWVALDRLERWF